MFRLSKITDYGIVLLAHMAQFEDNVPTPRGARELAEEVDLPAPVVSKVLKRLARQGVLDSQRGAKGGYALARRPDAINVAEMIDALEGPVAMTECAVGPHMCSHEGSCAVRTPWQVINGVVHESLRSITLADLIDPRFGANAPILQILSSSSSNLSTSAGLESKRDA